MCMYISQEGRFTYREHYYFFFFFVALVHERVAGLEKCKHIDSIMHYFGLRYFCTHTECLNVHERSFT